MIEAIEKADLKEKKVLVRLLKALKSNNKEPANNKEQPIVRYDAVNCDERYNNVIYGSLISCTNLNSRN